MHRGWRTAAFPVTILARCFPRFSEATESDNAKDPQAEETAYPKIRRGHLARRGRACRTHAWHGFFRSEQRAFRALHSTVDQEPHPPGRPGTELPPQLLRTIVAQEAHVHDRRDCGRNRRRLRVGCDQRRGAVSALEELLLSDRCSPPRPRAARPLRANPAGTRG